MVRFSRTAIERIAAADLADGVEFGHASISPSEVVDVTEGTICTIKAIHRFLKYDPISDEVLTFLVAGGQVNPDPLIEGEAQRVEEIWAPYFEGLIHASRTNHHYTLPLRYPLNKLATSFKLHRTYEIGTYWDVFDGNLDEAPKFSDWIFAVDTMATRAFWYLVKLIQASFTQRPDVAPLQLVGANGNVIHLIPEEKEKL